MDEQWVVDRARLRLLLRQHPEWTTRQLMDATGRSEGWVKKWKKRLRQAAADDLTVLWGRSRARHTPCKQVPAEVEERIVRLRDELPQTLGRVAGPLPILYHLHRQEDLLAQGVYLPRSTSTLWAILERHGCIARPEPHERQPVERPEPMIHWQIDFKDVGTVPPDPDGKWAHVVEVLDVVDVGTSILVEAIPGEDYHAQTALYNLAAILLMHGLPDKLTFDRDPRFVGSATGSDFLSALRRFMNCMGIEVDVCPPRRPDLNAFVERYHRSYEQECVQRYRPGDLEQTREVTQCYKRFYNAERPNQALACGNRPPYEAFPSLPQRPRPPEWVDPDRWMDTLHNTFYARRVKGDGTVQIGKHRYYIGRHLRGRTVVLRLDARNRHFVVEVNGQSLKTLPIKGLHGELMPFQTYLDMMCREAEAEWRQYLRQRPRRRPVVRPIQQSLF